MHLHDRRRFIKGTAGTVGGMVAGRLFQPAVAAAATAPVKKPAHDIVPLGKTGIKLSRMAMGSGTNGTNHTSIQARLGINGFADLLVHGYDQGVNFFDTADQYGTHEHMREAMRRVGKNKVVLLTKTRAKTKADALADLDRFRRELGRDYLDIVLLHCMMTDTWDKDMEPVMEVLERAREKGIIRAHGVSCHTLGALKVAARTPWVQVDLARINPIGAHMDSDPATVISVLRDMKKSGKGIIGMKILGQGAMSNQVDRALKHAVSLDFMDTFTIGFASKEQMNEVTRKLATLTA